ncbi:MAG: hypothetical protein SF069_19110 [Phycisphaerae bacterium]|nr:hypothetical protein [Phycisphaerae bacterium]
MNAVRQKVWNRRPRYADLYSWRRMARERTTAFNRPSERIFMDPSANMEAAEHEHATVLTLCLKCDYDLRGLGAGACPECECVFDPADRTTVASRPMLRTLRYVITALIVAAILPVSLFSTYVTWFVAISELGRIPTAYVDDPKTIGPRVSRACALEHEIIGAACSLTPVCLFALAGAALLVFWEFRGYRRPDSRVARILVVAVVALYLLTFLDFVVDPLDVRRWAFD